MFHANLTITDNVFILAALVAVGLMAAVYLASWLLDKFLD